MIAISTVHCRPSSSPEIGAEGHTPASTKQDQVAQAPSEPAKEPAVAKSANPFDVAPADKPTLGASGEPDLSHETSCVSWRWTSIEPNWKRESIEWDANTRTLKYDGAVHRLDADGRVHDFGEGTAVITYDAQGNVATRGEPVPKTEITYLYKNTYDKQKRLENVDVQLTPIGGGKPLPWTRHRRYKYDENGLIVHMDIEVKLRSPLVAATLTYDDKRRVTRIEWSGRTGENELEQFTYDANGRLGTYERDGLVVPGGKARDGLLDWRQEWTYDAEGRPTRVEAMDGPNPDTSQRDITLFSAQCSELGRFAPDIFVYPYIPLPAASIPRFGG